MKETFSNLKRVYKKYGKEYKSSLVKIFIFSLFGIFTNICIPLLSAKFIINFTDSKFEQAIYMSLIILGVYAIENIKILLIRKHNQVFRRGTVRSIQMSLGREILSLEQETLDSNSSGTFIQRLTNDTEKMSRIFTNGMVIIIKFLSAIGSFIAILIIDYHMFLYYFIASLVLTILNYVKNEKVGEKDREFRKESDKVAGLTGELVRGARDIKMLYAKESFMKNLDERIIIQNEKNFEMRNIDMNYNLFIGYIKMILEFASVLLLVALIRNNVLTVAVAIALYNYRNTVLTNFMDIVSELLEECKNFNISSDRVFSIVNNKEFKKEKFGTDEIKKIDGNFEFKNVKFGYNDTLVLNGLNLKINSGKTYGLVGKSGSGKTTIFNLLNKLYNVNSGNILIDGKDINNLDEKSIRGNITIISQSPYIFNMSIRDNLKLVKNDVSDEEIAKACELACLSDYINTLPDKYDTVVGEGGVNLSGGQRQRLAIARALIQDTKIILFDEATSALDNETQSKIQKAIDNLKGNYTIIIIAHRLSTIVNCDKIFILEEGKISDSGTHKKLFESNKYYKQLCKTELFEK
ncbi:MAG: ABC transporter ATP-binding protein [Firmicutes bacterium]|nr:ABC transporter ATP-binding protein [Bacillota bacterium]